MAEQGARLLDLSRLVSRIGRGAFTGVDRVEAAYLRRFLSDDTPLFGLVRSSFGYTLFDRTGVEGLAARLFGDVPWGPPDLLSRLMMKPGSGRRGPEADLRRLALARTGRRLLSQTFAKHLPANTTWVNVGHSNLVISAFDAIHDLPGGRAVVLVHDTIPLDHPDWQKPGTVESFEARMRQVAQRADLVIHTAAATRARTDARLDELGRVPDGIVAPVGIESVAPKPSELPPNLGLDRPYFVVLGTIEPRKNHKLLLDIWELLVAGRQGDGEVPRLFIVGARGWANEAVFDRLDMKPAYVRELGTLSDGAVAALLDKAKALLMPSFVEGFGLPPGEALALGCPVIATDLPVYREVFGNNIVYLDPDDLYPWMAAIRQAARQERGSRAGATELPGWEDHFNLVLEYM